MADLREGVSGAFRRSSAAISIVILVSFTTMMLSTAYHVLAFTPEQFTQDPNVQEYENSIESISAVDEWTRTRYYWSNNLRVASVCVIGTPAYFGFNSVVATNYMIGLAITYNYHTEGAVAMLAVAAMFFVHGLLELTGFYIVAAVSFRAAWNLWKGMGGLIKLTSKGDKRFSWRLSKREKREIMKHRGTMEQLMWDFVALFLIGASLIFLAAPVEAYVSPTVGGLFLGAPALAAAFLVLVGLVYGYIVARGFKAMRGDLKLVSREMRLAAKGKWRPVHLSLLIFVMFSVSTLLRLIF